MILIEIPGIVIASCHILQIPLRILLSQLFSDFDRPPIIVLRLFRLALIVIENPGIVIAHRHILQIPLRILLCQLFIGRTALGIIFLRVLLHPGSFRGNNSKQIPQNRLIFFTYIFLLINRLQRPGDLQGLPAPSLIIQEGRIPLHLVILHAVLQSRFHDLLIAVRDLLKTLRIAYHGLQNVDLGAQLPDVHPAQLLGFLLQLLPLPTVVVLYLLCIQDPVCALRIALLQQTIGLTLTDGDLAPCHILYHIQRRPEQHLLRLLDGIQNELPPGGQRCIFPAGRCIPLELLVPGLHRVIFPLYLLQLGLPGLQLVVLAEQLYILQRHHLPAVHHQTAAPDRHLQHIHLLKLQKLQQTQLDGVDMVIVAVEVAQLLIQPPHEAPDRLVPLLIIDVVEIRVDRRLAAGPVLIPGRIKALLDGLLHAHEQKEKYGLALPDLPAVFLLLPLRCIQLLHSQKLHRNAVHPLKIRVDLPYKITQLEIFVLLTVVFCHQKKLYFLHCDPPSFILYIFISESPVPHRLYSLTGALPPQFPSALAASSFQRDCIQKPRCR